MKPLIILTILAIGGALADECRFQCHQGAHCPGQEGQRCCGADDPNRVVSDDEET